MHFASLADLQGRALPTLAKGPICVVLCEDDAELSSTAVHHVNAGFKAVLLALPHGVRAPASLPEGCHTVDIGERRGSFAVDTVNAVAALVPHGTWMGYVYNAEYLFTPFCEHRTVGEALHFCTEERRDAVLTYVVDLYASDLSRAGNGINRDEAWMDKTGYYALERWRDGAVQERQMDCFGGLRWRFEEHVTWEKRRIDRVALFRTGPEVRLRADHTLTVEEMNTYACPWHNSLTAAICSFRAAKALATNPGSRAAIPTFWWHNSERFDWSSQQLLDLGLMEPGQWF